MKYFRLGLPIFREPEKSLWSPQKLQRAVIVIVAAFAVIALVLYFYFYRILWPLIVYLYFGFAGVAIVASIFLFYAAVIYPLLATLYYRTTYILRAIL
ncbi:unnamed protein product [Rotaria sordida]|uniref:Uncharacterized protein n=1 Tax=Rotaria sordida TaxID=392033 RepID=A0A815GIA8_9BILA|nr:unnamed protein product [Rotaria sordida]CAF1595766.1 unnamed protein product [Rotaria sordida]